VSSSVKTILDAIVNDVAPEDARVSIQEEGLSLSWTQLSGPSVPGLRDWVSSEVTPGPSAVLTSLSARSLAIRAGTLIPGEDYVFQVECSLEGASAEILASGQASVLAQVHLSINLPPVPGVVVLDTGGLSQLIPRALIDTVRLLT